MSGVTLRGPARASADVGRVRYLCANRIRPNPKASNPKKYLKNENPTILITIMTWAQEDKASFGSEQFHTPIGRPLIRTESIGFVANRNGAQEATNTGRSWSPSPARNLWPDARPSWDLQDTGSSPDQMLPETTSGKKTPEWPEPSLNLGQNHSEETPLLNGTNSGTSLSLEISWRSPRTYEYVITQLSEESAKTILHQMRWSELVMSSSGQLEQGSREKLGWMPVWTVILKIRTPSFGADMLIRNMLLSMNLEEESISVTSSAGSTVIRSMWNLKDPQFLFEQPRSGSRQI